MSLKNRIKQTLFPWTHVKSKLSRFGFEKLGSFNDEDVFLMGYPKSGNTLLQFLTAYLVGGLPNDASLTLINAVVTEFYNNPYYFRLNSRHIFKAHELPTKEYRNVIYIVRDGRDVMLSYYKMLKNLGVDTSLEQLYNTGGKSFVGTWSDHVLKWKENPFNARILYIRFEDLVNDKVTTIQKIADFLNIEDYDVDSLVYSSSIQNMKIQENSFSWQRSKNKVNWIENGQFVRKGESKSYLSENVSSELISRFEENNKQALSIFEYI